jgi:hypothetical protein
MTIARAGGKTRRVRVIDTPDALLVCPRALSQKVKDVVAVLKARGRPER